MEAHSTPSQAHPTTFVLLYQSLYPCLRVCDPLQTGIMLKKNNTLKKLDLDKCGLQPEGLEEVIKGVHVNTKLEALVLDNNNIDSKRASCLGKNTGIMTFHINIYQLICHLNFL